MLLTLLLVEHNFSRFYTTSEQKNTKRNSPQTFDFQGLQAVFVVWVERFELSAS